jgi:hypothetical protein
VIRCGSVGTLVLISLAIMGSPGPATISLVATGSVRGLRRSVPYLLGIIVATTLVLLAVATGITGVLLALPAIGSVLIWISAAYILWLAYHIATAPPLSKPRSCFAIHGEPVSSTPRWQCFTEATGARSPVSFRNLFPKVGSSVAGSFKTTVSTPPSMTCGRTTLGWFGSRLSWS